MGPTKDHHQGKEPFRDQFVVLLKEVLQAFATTTPGYAHDQRSRWAYAFSPRADEDPAKPTGNANETNLDSLVQPAQPLVQDSAPLITGRENRRRTLPTRHRSMPAICLCAATLVLTLAVSAASSSAAEEPRGVLLRKGMITWQTPLAQARLLVEENIRPDPPVELVRRPNRPKPPGFGCQPKGNGVTQCIWACCVDLGEHDTVRFATLSFYNDKFYAYDVNFNTNLFSQLSASLVTRLGPPSSETQENRTNFNAFQGGLSSYIVSQKRWDVGDVAVLLFDRGAGGPLVGELYVAYRPLARQASPPKQDEPTLKLPF